MQSNGPRSLSSHPLIRVIPTNHPSHPGIADDGLGLLQLERRGAEAVAVAEEEHALALANSSLRRLDPLAPAGGIPQALEETEGAALDVGAIVAAHDRLDGLGRFVGVVEGDGGDVVVENVGFDDSVEQGAANETKLAVNGGSGSANVIPASGSVVRKRWVGVLEIGDCN